LKRHRVQFVGKPATNPTVLVFYYTWRRSPRRVGRSGLADPFVKRGQKWRRISPFCQRAFSPFLSVPYLFVAAAGQPRPAEFGLYPADSNKGSTNLQLDETRGPRRKARVRLTALGMTNKGLRVACPA